MMDSEEMRGEQLKALTAFLCRAEIERKDAEGLIAKAVRISVEKDTSVMIVLQNIANPGAKPDSLEYRLHIALQKINANELNLITMLMWPLQ